jgi:hypothetical protein
MVIHTYTYKHTHTYTCIAQMTGTHAALKNGYTYIHLQAHTSYIHTYMCIAEMTGTYAALKSPTSSSGTYIHTYIHAYIHT